MSNEWLTTGQMIDRLKVGEKAECVNEHAYRGVIIKRKTEGLYFGKNLFELTDNSFDAKWIILPEYVSFEEAMKALKFGEKVKIHLDDGEKMTITSIYATFPQLCLNDYIESKWTIEDDTP